MSLMEATTAYKRGTPLRANSNAYREDIKQIRKASRPVAKAERLVRNRIDAKLTAKVDAMLLDLQGRKKRYCYDQAAAHQLEHLCSGPLDPHTQMPLWRELLLLTKDRPTDRHTFMSSARNILGQFNLRNSKIG